MRLTPSRLSWMLPVLALCYASGPAAAQPNQASATAGGQASGAATAAPAPRAQVGFQRRAQLTPAEQVAQGNAIVARMQAAAATVQHQLEEARGQRDIVKTICLNDKLSQVDVAVKSASERTTTLGLAAQRNDSELSNHEFTILTVLGQRSQQLTAEANQCIGEDSAFGNQASTTVSIDPTLAPGGDTTVDNPGGGEIAAAPPVGATPSEPVSPTQ